MLVLITAAGSGLRFVREGITTPKPLIRPRELSLLEFTLLSFELLPGDQLLIAVQRSHHVREQLEDSISALFPDRPVHWIELDRPYPGQLATALTALEQFDPQGDTSLLIHNCDTSFSWKADLRPPSESYGSMAVFTAEGEHWSFGKPHPEHPDRAVAIAEKQRISNLASIGLYGFRSMQRFLVDARQQLDHGHPLNGEHFVAPLLQSALAQGETILLPRAEGVQVYGTPTELAHCFEICIDQLKEIQGR